MRSTRKNSISKNICDLLSTKFKGICQSQRNTISPLSQKTTRCKGKSLQKSFCELSKTHQSKWDQLHHYKFLEYPNSAPLSPFRRNPLSKSKPIKHSGFEQWQKKYVSFESDYKKRRTTEAIIQISKLNSKHSGVKYIQNSPGYIIEANNVSKWFSNRASGKYQKVLHDVRLRIKDGEFVVVVGYSGSGKSTLLNILSCIERPSNGQIVVANHNLIALTEKELTMFRKDNMSFIFQSYALLPELTVRENIMQGAALQEEVYRRLDLDELSELIGVKEHLDKSISQLSGGQQQRVSIIKSVIKNPKILFADEPTSAVDEDTAKSILRIFQDINKRYKTTIILITHNPIIALMATRKITVARGRIVECVKQKPLDVDQLPWVSWIDE